MPEPTASAAGTGVWLGLDVGTRDLGVAVGNDLTGRARPLKTLAMQPEAMLWAALDGLGISVDAATARFRSFRTLTTCSPSAARFRSTSLIASASRFRSSAQGRCVLL